MREKLYKEQSERMKIFRDHLGLSQREMAAQLRVVRGTVAAYETGVSLPSKSVLELLRRDFNLNREWLLSGTGEMLLPAEPADEDDVDKLAREHGLSAASAAIIRAFIALPKDQQEAMRGFMVDVASSIKEAEGSQDVDDAAPLVDDVEAVPDDGQALMPLSETGPPLLGDTDTEPGEGTDAAALDAGRDGLFTAEQVGRLLSVVMASFTPAPSSNVFRIEHPAGTPEDRRAYYHRLVDEQLDAIEKREQTPPVTASSSIA